MDGTNGEDSRGPGATDAPAHRPRIYTHKHFGVSTSRNPSLHVRWDVRRCDHGDPHPPPPKDAIVFYTGSELEHAVNHDVARRVAFLLETRFIAPQIYERVVRLADHFDAVLTYDEDLMQELPGKCVFYPHSGCEIDREDFRIYEKPKLVSFIASAKRMGPPGHAFRFEFMDAYRARKSGWSKRFLGHVEIDFYGHIADNFVAYKLDSLRDYRFQIVVENNISDVYFTEKIIDCFVTGTIPIYRGTPRVADFFDPEGILRFESMEGLCGILATLTPAEYDDRIEAVRRNFALAQRYVLAEDWVFENTDLFVPPTSRDR